MLSCQLTVTPVTLRQLVADPEPVSMDALSVPVAAAESPLPALEDNGTFVVYDDPEEPEVFEVVVDGEEAESGVDVVDGGRG